MALHSTAKNSSQVSASGLYYLSQLDTVSGILTFGLGLSAGYKIALTETVSITPSAGLPPWTKTIST